MELDPDDIFRDDDDDPDNDSLNRNETEEGQQNERDTAAGVNLPSELIYDILCRLPVTSVGKFRCVCKDWKTLLSSPKFLKDQFHFNNHQNKIIILQDYKFHSIDFRNDCNNEGNPVAIYEALNFDFRSTDIRYHIVGSCNGLILLHDFRNFTLSIVNPITHELRQLPSIPKSVGRDFCKFGFGYCLNDDDYTVIVVLNHTRSSPVYMLKRNLWKRVEDSPLLLHGCGAFVNGCIHWLGSQGLDNSTMVCAFDLTSERFEEVKKPEGLKKGDGFGVNVLGGCLCLIVRHRNATTDIWVMKKYGLTDSWTKYVVYTDQNYQLHPLFFWNCDEPIVAEGEGNLILCNLKQKTSAIMPVIGDQCPEFSYIKWTFAGSLFSPN